MRILVLLCLLAGHSFFLSCSSDDPYTESPTDTTNDDTSTDPTDDEVDALFAVFGNNIDLNNLLNYADQNVPAYIDQDNTGPNYITNAGATLGRVLFYDRNLSTDNTVACATCHMQSLGFSDSDLASTGVNGVTGRHSMRLINTRFSNETQFFWDERAASLEDQTTQPIRDHNEMGFSGEAGAPIFDDLVIKLEDLDYYAPLFTAAFGDPICNEERIQQALGQFISSIQSFDSRYDQGRAASPNDGAPFVNFTAEENQGKQLFLAPPNFNGAGQRVGGGVGCAGCHAPPTFSIDPNSLNNGVIGVLGSPGETDLTNTRSPSLRDLNGNGPFFHDGSAATLEAVLEHYNSGVELNANLDPRLRPTGNPQRLNLTDAELNALIAFLQTLSGDQVYADSKWSDPFQ